MPPGVVAFAGYCVTDRGANHTHHPRNVPLLRRVQYLLRLRTDAFALRRCVLSQDPQDAEHPATLLPRLLSDRRATRARRRNHFLLRRGGHPGAPRIEMPHSPTPETFRPHPSQKAHPVLAIWHFVLTIQVPPHSLS